MKYTNRNIFRTYTYKKVMHICCLSETLIEYATLITWTFILTVCTSINKVQLKLNVKFQRNKPDKTGQFTLLDLRNLLDTYSTFTKHLMVICETKVYVPIACFI